MNYWINPEVNFGTIKKGRSIDIVFKANINVPKIKNIETSCGCTKAKFDEKEREIKVTFKAGEIPRHITTGMQSVNQFVKVFYEDGTIETLSIRGVKTA
jgi:hypothetical protein